MRIKVTTTIQDGLWHRLQVQAVKQRTDVNDILEVLIADYLKGSKRWEKEDRQGDKKTAKKGGD